MDCQFPPQLFPSFYNHGPPDPVRKHTAGTWGCYDGVLPQGSSGPLSSWTFTSRHQLRGEIWRHTEPVPVPFLGPTKSFPWPSRPPNPQDFRKHMQNFFLDHSLDAFGCMGDILIEHFQPASTKDPLYKVQKSLEMSKFNMSSYSSKLDLYSDLLSDVVPAVPLELLGSLLHEELTEQRDRMLFSEGATGGALVFVPFSESSRHSQHGCLLYAGNQGNCLNFHRVELQCHRKVPSLQDVSSGSPFSFQLTGPVRQITSSSLFNDCCVAVRSDRFCGVWRFSEENQPQLLQVVNSREIMTCVSTSPHVLGEVLVASESGAANLWTVGRGMQKFREEDRNLYFNAKSSWRWCEFSAHPRVMVYADRTGVELTDIRESPASSHTLFRISNTSECRSGERVILSRYLGDVHPFQHLVTTQSSAYIMDERFPCLPMLKRDHMMQFPPMFCHMVSSPASSGSMARTTKVLLGSQNSQEVTLLQYSGGRAEACSSQGPLQALFRPRDSLKRLPVQIPHRRELATSRLCSPAAGLTCIQQRGEGSNECMCVLQLTEAGDIFYQILEHKQPDTSGPPAAEDQPLPSPKRLQAHCKLIISDTSGDEGVIGPTQNLTEQIYVPETPEREQQELSSDASSEASELRGRCRNLKQHLQVVVNSDQELDEASGLDAGVEDGNLGEENGSSGLGEVRPCERQMPVELSDGTLTTWKLWLQKLMAKNRKKNPRPDHQQHLTVKTEDFLHKQEVGAVDRAEEERVRRLRRDLKARMSKRSLLVGSALNATLKDNDVLTVPGTVNVEVWKDNISQRLTLSWQREEAWLAWWQNHLGMNSEKKREALRRKRRKEKEAKRATGLSLLERAQSFTSSVSYQEGLSDFSDSSSWYSAASQGAMSEPEGNLSEVEDCLDSGTSKAVSPSTLKQSDTPVPTTTTSITTPHKQGDEQTPGSTVILSQTPKPDTTAASRQRDRHPAQNISQSAPQNEPLQRGSHFLEEEDHHPPLPAVSPFQPRSLRMDLSQDDDAWMCFSQSQSLSQSSQGRRGLSQTSQTKKKKSRMGF